MTEQVETSSTKTAHGGRSGVIGHTDREVFEGRKDVSQNGYNGALTLKAISLSKPRQSRVLSSNFSNELRSCLRDRVEEVVLRYSKSAEC